MRKTATTRAAAPAPRSRSRPGVALLVAAVAGLLTLVARPDLVDAPARFLVLRDAFEKVDAVLVMAGDPGYERTRTAARLVIEGRARLLILTGGEPGPGDSSSSLAAFARRMGVREDQIRTEAVSTGTHSSMDAVRGMLAADRVKALALVTSPYHQRRAFESARRVFGNEVRILNWPAEPSFWSPEGWWRTGRSRQIVISEHAKRAYYALRGWI